MTPHVVTCNSGNSVLHDTWLENLCHRAIEKAAPNHQLTNVDLRDYTTIMKLIDRATEIVEE